MRITKLGIPLIAVACGGDRAPPPSAPLTVDVAPAAPITSGPLAQLPPPNPERRVLEEAPAAPPTFNPPDPLPGTVPASTYGMPPRSGPPGNAPFDKAAAASALGTAQIRRCFVPGGPTGPGHATITFDPSGSVSAVSVESGVFPGTPVGGCIARVYGAVKVPPFSGSPVRVGKSFLLQ